MAVLEAELARSEVSGESSQKLPKTWIAKSTMPSEATVQESRTRSALALPYIHIPIETMLPSEPTAMIAIWSGAREGHRGPLVPVMRGMNP